MIAEVGHLVKGADVRLVICFLNKCLPAGYVFELEGRRFCFEGGYAPVAITRGSLRAFAAALILAADGEQRTTYEVLWRCAVESDLAQPSGDVLRRFASSLRSEWEGVCLAARVKDVDGAALPGTAHAIRLGCLQEVFNVPVVRDVVHLLRPPQLHVSYKGVPKSPISLEMLEAGAWKMVGRSFSDDCPDKIRIDHDEFLSRKAFEIRLGRGCLNVRLVSKVNRLFFHGVERAQFDVPPGEAFTFGDLTFCYRERPLASDTSTPVHPSRRSRLSGGF